MAGPANMTTASASLRLGEIDALRSFAMLSVMALHAKIMPMGWAGVWLFYVISGYVVTLSIVVQHPDGAGLARLGGFVRRRIARIVPVYYLFVLVGLGVTALQNIPQRPESIAGLFLFFNNWTAINLIANIRGWPSGHLWTLSVEMQFYLLYGLALCLLPHRRTVQLLIAMLILCPLARFVAGEALLDGGWKPLDAAYWVYAGPGLHFDIFAMGALLAFAQQALPIGRIARPLAVAGLIALAAYCAAYLAINHVVRGEHGTGLFRNIVSGILVGEHRETFVYSAIGLATAGFVALAAARDPWVTPVLGLSVLQWIGRISYGGYLFHVLGLAVARYFLHLAGFETKGGAVWLRLIQFPLGLAVTLLLAWASWHWFETPMRRWLSGERKARRAPGTRPAGAMAR